MENTAHYFDWAATSPSDEQILKNALDASLSAWANPSSIHQPGQKARELFEQARTKAARVLGVKSQQLYFTSGGTESDHLPLLSMLNRPTKGHIIISAIEHPALREQALTLQRNGWQVDMVNPDKNGFISPESIVALLNSQTVFVSVMAVNNETGCIQPVSDIAQAVADATKGKRKPHFHTDCVQAAGKIPLDFLSNPAIDSAAFSAHKICGPRGIGLLYLDKPFNSFLVGGGQEQNIRSGTENLFGAIAFADCLEKYAVTSSNKEALAHSENQKQWTRDFVKALSGLKGCTIVPEIRAEDDSHFSPFVVQAAFRDIPGNVMVRALDAKGFYISTGSACSAKKQSRPILAAMGVRRDIQDTAVRFSFGSLTTEQAMKELFEAVKEVTSVFVH